jgi:hypothetical protein
MDIEQQIIEEYEHLARLCRYAGFDFDPVTKHISFDGFTLPMASAAAKHMWAGPHDVIATASTEYETTKEFLSMNGITK